MSRLYRVSGYTRAKTASRPSRYDGPDGPVDVMVSYYCTRMLEPYESMYQALVPAITDTESIAPSVLPMVA